MRGGSFPIRPFSIVRRLPPRHMTPIDCCIVSLRSILIHPGLLAQRELKDALGFKWVETYVPPPPRNENNNNPAQQKKPNMPQQKAIAPPKL